MPYIHTTSLQDLGADTFATLIRDLNAEGKASEVSVITAWLMESQEVFANDETAMIAYVRAYLRRFRGRAFPQKFEFALFAKSIMSSMRSGGLSEDQKETLKSAKKATQEIESLKQKVTSLTDQVKAIKNNSSNQSGPSKNACHFCGMVATSPPTASSTQTVTSTTRSLPRSRPSGVEEKGGGGRRGVSRRLRCKRQQGSCEHYPCRGRSGPAGVPLSRALAP